MKKEILGLGKDSIVYGFGSVITRFIGLFTLPLFTSKLSTEEYGILAMIALLTMVVNPVFSMGLSSAMGPNYYEKNNNIIKSSVVWTGFTLNLISSLILIFISFIFQQQITIAIKLSTENSNLISLSLISYSFTIISTCLLQRIQFEKEVITYVFITLSTSIIAILTSLLNVVVLDLGVKGMILGQLFANSSCFMLCFINAIKKTRYNFSFKIAVSMLKLGLPLILSNVFLFFILHSNKYILEWESDLESVGIYSIGFSLGSTISIITTGINNAWYPFYMSYMKKQNECSEIFGKIFSYYFLGVGYICILYFIFSRPLIMILTNTNFYEASSIIGWVAIAFFSQTLFSLLLPGIYYKKEIPFVTIIQGSAAFCSLIINYFLISKFGIVGAGIGLALGNLLMTVFTFGWNIYRKKDYPLIKYEWKRISYFCLIFISIITLNGRNNFAKLESEILWSILFSSISFVSLIFLINNKERKYLKSILF